MVTPAIYGEADQEHAKDIVKISKQIITGAVQKHMEHSPHVFSMVSHGSG